MGAPHAPVETGPAHRPSAAAKVRHVDADGLEEAAPRAADPNFFAVALKDATCEKGLEHRHGVFAGKVVVADARLPHRRVFRSRTRALRAGIGRDPTDGLDHRRDLRT